MVFLIRPVIDGPRQAGTALVDKLDRAALVALHKATATIPNEHRDSFQRILDDALYQGYRSSVNLSYDLMAFQNFKVTARVNAAGRVKRMSVHNFKANKQLELPETIESLEYLENLDILHCEVGSIPYDALSKLPNLVSLVIAVDSESLFPSKNFNFETKLPHLKKLTLRGVGITSSPRFFGWIRDCLPSLEHLEIRNHASKTVPLIRENTTRFPATIRSISFHNCGIDDAQLETLVFDVLRNCPSIEFIDLSGNNIKSFRSIHRKLRAVVHEPWFRFCFYQRRKLCKFWIEDNPVADTLNEEDSRYHREEVEVACGFLQTACSIQSLGLRRRTSRKLFSELALNSCGRYLLHRTDDLAAALWPEVLAATQRRLDKGFWCGADAPSAMYHFLRNGPVLRNNCSGKG